MSDAPQIAPALLAMLRCPVAVKTHNTENPGKLTVAHGGWWLVSEESRYKYPVHPSGIPNMVVEVGEKWVNVNVNDLPVPPPQE